MKKKKILLINCSASTYYNIINEELSQQFTEVEFHNAVSLKPFKYESFGQWLRVKANKLIGRKNFKSHYRFKYVMDSTANKSYDYIIIIRPDVLLDAQLKELKNKTKHFIAYFHDSINDIPREKDIIHFFNKVYSFEKSDVKKYNLQFLPNFIYLKEQLPSAPLSYNAFTIMSDDYRVDCLEKLGHFFKTKNINFKFLVQSDKRNTSTIIDFIKQRKSNEQVLQYTNKTHVLVDIHKYRIQNGLTFRVFESLFFEKKLITTNADIKNYDFYNPNNIIIIDPNAEINIPEDFFSTPYEKVPSEIYQKYHYTNWLKTILS
ncbi:hypothetical protein [Pseudotamlana agarivorans]|uniref:hypothetical protein n=1 Tax=Pseudotamlana agarivorans TaxID=481183 RepID=UPI0008361899|nr:hypothetical protein [Tamlana agarivorans]